MRRLTIVVLVLVLGVAGAAVFRDPFSILAPGEALNESVPAVRASRGTLTVSTVALGTVKSKVGAEVKVGSRLSGVLAELHVGIGDEVAEGDLLALLDDAEWRVRVAAIEAELAEANAELVYARTELDAMEQVAELAPIDVAGRRRNLAVREAAVQRIRARLAEAEIQLGYTRILAPVSGTIASVSTYEGETVAASFAAPTFVTIVDLERLEVHAFVDETDIGRVHAGQAVSFRVDAYPGRELDGVVSAIYPRAELINNVVNYVAVIDIAGAEHVQLRPEMSAHVSFVLDRRPDVVNVPRSAVLREDATSFAIVRRANGWSKTRIETGLSTPQRIEVVSGLEEGDVIAADATRWADGQLGEP